MTTASMIWVVSVILAAGMLFFYARSGGLVKSALFTAFSGMGALGVLWIVGRFFSVPVDITPLSVAVSAFLGVPGVLAMLIIHLI